MGAHGGCSRFATELHGSPEALGKLTASRAPREMLPQGAALGRREVSFDPLRDAHQQLPAIPLVCVFPHADSSSRRNCSLARCSLVFTLSSETSITAATSRVESPSMSRRKTVIR